MRSLVFFFFLATVSTAYAEEPAPQQVVVQAEHSWPGPNKIPMVIGFDKEGCTTVQTIGAQSMRADQVAIVVEATASARVECLKGVASARATVLAAEGEKDGKKALADAAAYAVRAAADAGLPVYVDNSGVAVTGNAAPLAAAGGMLGLPMSLTQAGFRDYAAAAYFSQ